MKTAALAALATLALVSGVTAHSWFDPWCCNGRDCQPIPDGAVKVTPQGYVVTLRPSDHPALARETEPRTYLVTFDKARVSLDPEQRFFACIYPDPSTLRCFYARPLGG